MSRISITIDGETTTNIESYSVQEDITSIDPSDYSGGFGQVTVTGQPLTDEATVLTSPLLLQDTDRGTYDSTTRGLGKNNVTGRWTYTGDSILARLNVWVTIPPSDSRVRLDDFLESLFDLCGVNLPLEVDTSLASRLVLVPGFLGNAGDYLKQFLAAQQIEMSLVFSRVVIRPLRQLIAYDERRTSEDEELNTQVTATQVEVFHYDMTYGSQVEVYPVGTDPDPTPFTVNAGEVITQTIQLEGAVISPNQPVAVDSVDNRRYDSTAGVYSVTGNDGLPITAAQWTAAGGKIQVRVTDDPTVLEVVITGARIADLSPMQIAMSAGASSTYNSLHITARGYRWVKNSILLDTGAGQASSDAPQIVQVDNIHIQSLAQAYTAGLITAGRYAGPTMTLSGSAWSINDPGDGSVGVATTFEDVSQNFDDINIVTFGDFSTEFGNGTFADVSAYFTSLTADQFSAQLFGNGIGSRMRRDHAFYRVTSTTTTQDEVQYTAEMDTTLQDFADHYGSMTFAESEDVIPDTFFQFNIKPLA